MQLQSNNKTLYQDLLIIIQAYEEEVVQSDSPLAFKALALKPISGMNRLLTASEGVLEDSTERIDSSSIEEAGSVEGFSKTENLGQFINVKFGSDLQNLTGSDTLLDYLDDCFDCDLRLQFKWQLAPFNLFDAILDLLDELMRVLDLLELGLDPNIFLKNLCEFLSNLHWLCIPDLVALLLSLKAALTLKRTNLLSISIDWTVLLAPLLQAVLQILDSLLDGAFDIVTGPVDCLIGALKTIADLEKAANALALQVQTGPLNIEQKITDNFRSVGVDKDLDVTVRNSTEPSNSINIETEEKEKKIGGPFEFYTGTNFDVITIPDALSDPRFAEAHWTSKLLVPIAEMLRDIRALKRKLDEALSALKGLTSDGLLLQVKSIVGILYILQMIQLAILLIDIISELKKGNFTFCEDLKNDPEKYNNMLSKSFEGLHLSIEEDDTILASYNGKQISTSQPCLKTNSQLNNWIADLTKGNR